MSAPQPQTASRAGASVATSSLTLALELVDLDCQGAAAIDELACDPGHGALEARETLGELVEVAEMVQRPEGGFVARVEFVQVPAKPADHAGSLADQVFAMVDKQPYFAL